MRIFLAGDHYSGTGPANVTRYYIENLPKGTLFQKRRSKLMRIPEIILNTIRSDVVVYSGYSRQNIIGLKLAKILKKPAAYIMHGCVEYENSINLEPDEEMNSVERKTMELSDSVIAVSGRFCDWLKNYYPEYSDKIDFVTNGIDMNLFDRTEGKDSRNSHLIFTVGGGMPRKKVKYICKAVKKLRETYDPGLSLCIIGADGADSKEIEAYDFVDNKGLVPFDESIRLFKGAALFVQNSSFETFGLAPVEALACGCPILCSRQVGALELIDNLQSEDVIEKYEDADEIAEKIRYNLEHSNVSRLIGGLKRESYSWKEKSRALELKLLKLVSKK